ncbi:MAG: hypothetical protein IPI72_09770 [Flavobacteriales bacterium]|nr:hypothetical protein [Flavobacteriales bacterium]
MQNGQHGKDFASFDLVLFLWGYRKLILGITLLGLVTGLVTASVITPLYKSEVVMFPALTNTASKAVLSESYNNSDLLGLGDVEDSEKLLQMLHADEIRDRVVDHFDLMRVYVIDPAAPHVKALVQDAFEDHVSFENTKFKSIRVQVLDPDPQRAADMANFIADQVDSVWTEMEYARAEKGYALVAVLVQEVEQDIQRMTDSLMVVRRLGIHDYYTQVERLTEYLGAAIVKGHQRAVREIDERFKVLAEYGGAYVSLHEQLGLETRKLSALRMKMSQAQADMKSGLPHKFVVNRATPADKKYSPVRWMVVTMNTVSAFLLALIIITIHVNIRKTQTGHAE